MQGLALKHRMVYLLSYGAETWSTRNISSSYYLLQGMLVIMLQYLAIRGLMVLRCVTLFKTEAKYLMK